MGTNNHGRVRVARGRTATIGWAGRCGGPAAFGWELPASALLEPTSIGSGPAGWWIAGGVPDWGYYL